MKKFKFLLSIVMGSAIVLACNNSNSESPFSKDADSSQTKVLIDKAGSNVPEEFREGAELVTSNDCLTCHKVSDTSVGPSFQSIANRYERIPANVNKLLVSVQKGSTGAWGRNVMTPHPTITPQDGTKMLNYILSNRTK